MLLEWIYLILIIAFVTWTVQILMVYRRQVDNIQAQIEIALSNQQDVAVQAEEYEARAEELAEQLADLKSESDTLEQTEKKMEQEVNQFRQQQASRRPTRHRVETDETVE
jgi:predicted nuclease with TOPRIM domain